jgi:putative MATE family efflux protein
MTYKNHRQSELNPKPDVTLSTIMRLGFPVAIQSALVAILSLADVLMVSDLGIQATAAVGIASKWLFIATMLIAGMSQANGILVAQYWGKSDPQSAKTITMLVIAFGAKLLIPVSLVMTLCSGYIMLLQTSDPIVIELASSFLWYGLPILIFTHIVMVSESALRSSGDTFTPLWLSGSTIFINIGLNYWLINGGIGVPAMGVAGAALATTIARLIQVLMMYAFLYQRKHWLITSASLTYSKKLWSSYKHLAIPSTLSGLTWAAGVMAYQMIFGHLGTTELAVFSLIGPFESLCYSLFFGISVACSVLIGHSLGRDEFAEAFDATQFFIKIVSILGLLAGVILLFAKEPVLAWLNLATDELHALASPALTILCFAIVFRMLNTVIINGILRSGGDNLFCLRMDFVSSWVVGVPLTAFAAFVLKWDFQYVYLMMLTEDIVKLCLCFHRYLSRRWINNLTLAAD